MSSDQFFRLAAMLEEAAEIVRNATVADPVGAQQECLVTILNEADRERLLEIMQFFDRLV